MVFGSKDKLDGKIPDEFLADMKLIKETREYTVEIVKYMEKLVSTAIPPNITNPDVAQQKEIATYQDELQKLSRTCENSMHYFYEQRYYYVLKATSEVCTQLSKKQKLTIQGIYDRAMMPIKVWVEEEYPRLLRDLQKCHRLKKENDSAAAAVASKPTPTKEAKANAVREQYELQLRMCKIEMEKTKKIRKHHTNCLKIMASLHHNYSKTVLEEAEMAQTQLIRQLSELEDKEMKNKEAKEKTAKEKTSRSSK